MGEPAKVIDAKQAADFAAIFEDHPIEDLICDARATVGVMTVGEIVFPTTVSDPTEGANCYLCSPSTAYIDYALAEVEALNLSRIAKVLTRVGIKACAPLVRATGLDGQVQVNNWFVSTNPSPDLNLELVEAIKASCLATHPTRAIVMRSLNDVWDVDAMKVLRAAGFKLLAARQIYLLANDAHHVSRDVKRDAKLLEETQLKVAEGKAFSQGDFEQCAALYRALYLDKYTTLNPHYTAAFLRELQVRGVMTMVALRDADGQIVGFTGLFESARTLTQPFVGYDIARPQNEGIYRMLMQIGRDHAKTRGLDYNMSAGSAAFKRNRGASAAIEYTAVYVAHRPWHMRAATVILELATRVFAIPIVKRFET
ncbi:GNAT family N-acetyltransferase [Octadecabacter sp. G9-8]|uniref:GNAT family N-acetyltransferase n=1 Tax=Octadecabacter dasysiphoniae TaxID=2909341 RepID=A0ABS9CWB4_9RHOB|nr:GNAT family N-acetyltransferase [Octadecabacter dasysiphoniae]MCF2870674.1 GNAT family N-acetyltransferase [Octadecabacter dasysiphoniae]